MVTIADSSGGRRREEVFCAILINILYGGFKFEAQRALKIDGTLLKVF